MFMKPRYRIFWIICLTCCLLIAVTGIALPLLTGQLTVTFFSFDSSTILFCPLLWIPIIAGFLWLICRVLLLIHYKWKSHHE